MIRIHFIFICLVVAGLTGCQSAQERAAEADAQIQEEKLEIMRDYRACLKKYEGKKGMESRCDQLRKAAEAFF